MTTSVSTEEATTPIMSTVRALPNTFIPELEYHGVCNYETCQLGKCLQNGTCECIKPAFGKYCDRIDECFVLRCVRGNCVTGKGCVCENGFTGKKCETSLYSTSTTSTTIITTTTTTTATTTATNTATTTDTTTATTTSTHTDTTSYSATYTSTTVATTTTTASSTTSKIISILNKVAPNLFHKHIVTNKPTTNPESTVVTTFSRAMPSTEASTTPVITSCDNGGLFIDNSCICLNQFTGLRCEIAPSFSDSATANYLTKEPELEGIDRGMDLIQNIKNTKEELSNTKKITSPNSNEDLIPIFTISRYNTRNKNTSGANKNLFWPWFGKFMLAFFQYSV